MSFSEVSARWLGLAALLWDPQSESQACRWKSWVDITNLHLCSLYYYIFSAFFSLEIQLFTEREKQIHDTIPK